MGVSSLIRQCQSWPTGTYWNEAVTSQGLAGMSGYCLNFVPVFGIGMVIALAGFHGMLGFLVLVNMGSSLGVSGPRCRRYRFGLALSLICLGVGCHKRSDAITRVLKPFPAAPGAVRWLAGPAESSAIPQARR